MNRADGLYSTDGLQMLFDYGARTDGQADYVGYAAKGIASDQNGWLLYKFTFTTIGAMDVVSKRQVANGAWDSRASYTYA